jgi:hypothetical protein
MARRTGLEPGLIRSQKARICGAVAFGALERILTGGSQAENGTNIVCDKGRYRQYPEAFND